MQPFRPPYSIRFRVRLLPFPLTLLPPPLNHDGVSFPPSNAPSCLLYKSSSCPHHIHTRTASQSLRPSRVYPCYAAGNCRHTQGGALPCLSLEAVQPHRAMCGPPSRLFPSSTLFISLNSRLAQRRFRSPHVHHYYL